MAWAFELTPEGLKREKDIDRSEPIAEPTRRKLNNTVFAVLMVAIGILGAMVWFGQNSAPPDTVSAAGKSIAVLPFDNRSADTEDSEFFAAGVHDELLTLLSKLGDLRVISRTSVERLDSNLSIPEIGSLLGVAMVMEGQVQRAGNRLRINVQLISTEKEDHIWANTYDRELTATDVFTIQSEIARSVANALQATLSGAKTRRPGNVPTQSLAAFERYTIGKQLLEIRTRESLRAAEEYFRQVIELDADYALAHSGLADALMILPEYDASADPGLTYEQSEAAIARALELDPDLPEALASKAWSRLIHGYAWSEAEQLLRRALEIQPNHSGALHWLSHLLSWQGEHAEAIHTARRALESDPHSGLMRMNLSYILMDAGHFEESIALALENQRLNPERYEQWGNLWLTYLRAERPRDAAEVMQRWAELTGRDAEAIEQVGQAFIRYTRSGKSQQLDSRLVDRAAFGLEDLGQVYAFVGDGDRALEALEDAVRERSGSRSVLSMKINPAYETIRESPRFRSLLQVVGLGQGE